MLKNEVFRLSQEVPKPPGEFLPKGCSERDIADFETRTGLSVPNDLREWLLYTNGPCIGPGGLFGILTERKSFDIENIFSSYSQWGKEGWIPVAGDGCGNYYVYNIKQTVGGLFPVYFIDTHDSPSKPAYVVASGLWQFLRFLLKRELGYKGWPFQENIVLSEDPEMLADFGIPRPWEI